MARDAPATGTLREGHVLVGDVAQANRLHNKAMIGAPTPENGLRLTLVEAAWLATQGKLQVSGKGATSAIDLVAAGPAGTLERFLVYADLRERGLAVRDDVSGLLVWPRGTAFSGEPAFAVHPDGEDGHVTGGQLVAWAEGQAVAGIVDADGAVTHYRLRIAKPSGTVAGTRPEALAARNVHGHAIATGESESGAAFAGTKTPLVTVLSRDESTWLGAASSPSVASPAYSALRAAGAIPKSGFRFGTALRAYKGDPDAGHADWLIDVAEETTKIPWVHLARGIRLAHGVRKAYLVAVGRDAAFVELSWFKP